ncbi:Holliday junction branch migration protein RuvA [bacterium]|nr:Holliday junction branch migration protein RuvA [bacterium]
MIDSITGILTQRGPAQVVVDVGSVSMMCLASLSTVEKLPALGEQIRLWTHLLVRDDQIELFGFATLEERHLFRNLLSVSGVGPRLALAILSGAQTDDLRRAVIEENVDRLQAIPRVGAKLAQRLVLELKDKLQKEFPEIAGGVLSGKDESALEAIQALLALGFGRPQAEKVVRVAVKDGAQGTEDILKRALRVS